MGVRILVQTSPDPNWTSPDASTIAVVTRWSWQHVLPANARTVAPPPEWPAAVIRFGSTSPWRAPPTSAFEAEHLGGHVAQVAGGVPYAV